MSNIMTPEYLAKGGTEHDHQVALFQWIALDGKRWLPKMAMCFAVPNGGGRTMSVGAMMKAEGVKRGVPDICLPTPCGQYHGLWIELKKPGLHTKKDGGRSEEQKDWHRRLIAERYAVVLCFGWVDAAWTLINYLQGEHEALYGQEDALFVHSTPSSYLGR